MSMSQGEVLIGVNYTLTKATDEVIELMKEEQGSMDFSSYSGKYKDKIKQRKGHNIVPLGIRTAYASITAGNTVTTTFQANYIALGSDATPVTENDTQLGNETLRALLTDRRHIDNVAFLDKFFGSSEVGGNQYNEIGIFIDGTASANSGLLLSRININENFQALESLTVNATITFGLVT